MNPRDMQQRGFLHVIAHGARGLPAADFHLLKKSSSDPYCILSLGGQRHRTQTVYSNLNPVWEQPFSFQVGTYLPKAVVRFLGDLPKMVEGELPPLEVRILDEDVITADDALGKCSLDLQQILECPEEWNTFELTVNPAGEKGSAGTLLISACWEPAPLLPAYAIRMISVAGYACGFVMLYLAGHCRWQGGGAELEATQQPGVGAATSLGSGVMLLSTILQFVTTHMDRDTRIDDLAGSQSASRGLHEALSAYGLPKSTSRPGSGDSMLMIKVAASRLMQYDISLIPTMDLGKYLHLPIIVVNWLLPFGGIALAHAAFALQILQDRTLQDRSVSIKAGHICTTLALLGTGAGLACAILAERMPRATARRRSEQVRVFREKTGHGALNFTSSPSKKESLMASLFACKS